MLLLSIIAKIIIIDGHDGARGEREEARVHVLQAPEVLRHGDEVARVLLLPSLVTNEI